MSSIHRFSVSGALLRLVTWPLRHIRWKIVLPYAFLTVVLAVAGSYLATNLVAGSLAERFDNQLTEAGRVVAGGVADDVDVQFAGRRDAQILESAAIDQPGRPGGAQE
ncbi:hypothetical protein LCGC14_2506250, partial [marine sediment metagenome]